jgi:hypothetical protein
MMLRGSLMPDKRSTKPMIEPEETPRYRHLSVERARAMRAEQARLAALYADRCMHARAAASYHAMLRWAGEYRRCAARCRRLGERIRAEVSGSPAADAERDPTVVPLARRHVPDAAPTGEAA